MITGANAGEVSRNINQEKVEIVYNENWQKGMASGIVAGVVGPGQVMPPFVGTSHDGHEMSSASLLDRGPLVLSFFRGHW